MAEGKKSFTAYCDWGDVFDEMTNEEAGILVKHLFDYVRDKDPEAKDSLTRISFAQIKSTLKRDLVKWREKSEKNRANANLRWNKNDIPKNANASERIKRNANHADKDTVTDTVNDKVIVNDINKKNSVFNFRKNMIDYGFSENLVVDWMKVRKTKKATNTETAFKGFIFEVEKCSLPYDEIIKMCVEKSWSGFKNSWMEKEKSSAKKEKPIMLTDKMKQDYGIQN